MVIDDLVDLSTIVELLAIHGRTSKAGPGGGAPRAAPRMRPLLIFVLSRDKLELNGRYVFAAGFFLWR